MQIPLRMFGLIETGFYLWAELLFPVAHFFINNRAVYFPAIV